MLRHTNTETPQVYEGVMPHQRRLQGGWVRGQPLPRVDGLHAARTTAQRTQTAQPYH